MARSARVLHGHHNLPTHATALVGRDREVADLRQLLLSDDGRLVTLTGVGGCCADQATVSEKKLVEYLLLFTSRERRPVVVLVHGPVQ